MDRLFLGDGTCPVSPTRWAAMDTAPKKLPPRVRIDGPKWILDGTPIEQNAFQREPYAGRPDWRGRSNYKDAELRDILATALRRPEQLALHVVGDAETDRLFTTMESLGPPEAWRAKRVRVEHGDGIRRDTLAQAVRLGVVVTQNPLHQGPPIPNAPPSLSMLRSLLSAGVPLALGSDAGPDEANPFLNIMMASTYRSSPGEALTREQALLAYTAGGAFAERQERYKGRIMTGMAADLAVLSQDVLLVPAQSLPATKSLLTLGGRRYRIRGSEPGCRAIHQVARMKRQLSSPALAFATSRPCLVAMSFAVGLTLCACSIAPPSPAAPATLPAVHIDPAALLRHIEMLASDVFDGRKPGTQGEVLTVDYLIDTFKRHGLAPGNPDGSYVQEVPLTGITSQTTVSHRDRRRTHRLAGQARLRRRLGIAAPSDSRATSELVFVGHGVVAPEYGWDDYKGVDLRGKTVVVLMDDPQVPDPADSRRLDPSMFKGDVKTYYATRDHKREAAMPQGAIVRITVHETARAGGTPFGAYANEDGREAFTLRDDIEPQFDADLVIPVERARDLFRRAGHDLDALRERARHKDFKPVALGVRLDAEVRNTLRELRSRNVVARVEGRDPKLKDEVVLYTAHWDHFGRDPSLIGDPIYHGALDNASGVAAVLEIARSYAALPEPPARSVLFIATTAEEAGLLGARHYAAHPLVPLARTLVDLNLDIINVWGRTADVQITGWGESDMDTLAMEVAAAQGKRVVPDQAPELGLYYRQDAFEFARAGVPSLYVRSGVDFIGKPPGYRREKVGAYIANDYHQVTDTVRSDWDLAGGAEQAEFAFAIGWRLAQGAPFSEMAAGHGVQGQARRDASARHVESRPPPVISCCSNRITTKLSPTRVGMNPRLAQPSDPLSVTSSGTEELTGAGLCIRWTTKVTNRGPASRASTSDGRACSGRCGTSGAKVPSNSISIRPRACSRSMPHTRPIPTPGCARRPSSAARSESFWSFGV